MRAVLLILILGVVAVIAAVATGFLDISQTRSARAPDIDTSRNGVTASGGQAPAFDVETGSVSVGAKPQNVTVPLPTVEIRGAGNEQANAAADRQAPPAGEQSGQ